MLSTYILFVASCSSRHAPAPVISLSTATATKQNLAVIQGDEYKVQAGDTLFAVAFYSGNDYRDLARYNNISAPYTIKIGQTLRLTKRAKTANSRTNIDRPQRSRSTDKIKVDPNKAKAYRENEAKANQKNKNGRSRRAQHSFNKEDIDAQKYKHDWIWPASGKHTIATVGSDGAKRGLDIKGKLGANIVAAAGGKVVYAGNALKGYGNLIIIKHSDKYLSAYAHNQSILVSEQTYVKQGQKIATMGNSGASDVMLHFEIRKQGKSVDPFAYLPSK